MTEEECFRKNYPDSCYGDKPLSPHWDFFQDGAEFGYNKAKEEWKKHFLQCSSPFCLDNFSEVKCYGELGNMAKKESE